MSAGGIGLTTASLVARTWVIWSVVAFLLRFGAAVATRLLVLLVLRLVLQVFVAATRSMLLVILLLADRVRFAVGAVLASCKAIISSRSASIRPDHVQILLSTLHLSTFARHSMLAIIVRTALIS